MLEIKSSVAGQVKPITYEIDTCHFLDWYLGLIGHGKDWLAQRQDNMIKWDVELWCWQPGIPMGSTPKSALSQASCYPDMTLAVVRM